MHLAAVSKMSQKLVDMCTSISKLQDANIKQKCTLPGLCGNSDGIGLCSVAQLCKNPVSRTLYTISVMQETFAQSLSH